MIMKQRKIIAFIIILLFLSVSFVSAVESAPYSHRVLGYYRVVCSLVAEMDSSVLPFDIEGSLVAKNNDYQTSVSGLRVGSYSLITNSSSFTLSVTHDKLENGSSMADYRLYLYYPKTASSSDFVSCKANETVSFTSDDAIQLQGDEIYQFIDQSIYVSMEETAATLAALPSGIYTSTITLLLTSQN